MKKDVVNINYPKGQIFTDHSETFTVDLMQLLDQYIDDIQYANPYYDFESYWVSPEANTITFEFIYTGV